MIKRLIRWLLRIPDHTGQPRSEQFLVNCPVCGYLTISREAPWPHLCQWDICPVCFWEDDDEYLGGGANHGITLRRARENFKVYGAMSPHLVKEVRPPTEAEKDGWLLPPPADDLMRWTLDRVENDKRGLVDFFAARGAKRGS